MLNTLTLIIVTIGITIGSLVPNFSAGKNLSPGVISSELSSLQKTVATLLGKLDGIIRSKNNLVTSQADAESETVIDTTTTDDRIALNAKNITYFVNKERTQRGLKALKTNSKLIQSARTKAADMIVYNYFAHASPVDSKKDFSYFIDKQSYVFIRVSENLAMGEFTSADDVVNAWMKSPGHAANILFPDYRDTGVSVQVKPNPKGGSDIIIVQHFGVPKNTCPSISDEITTSLQSIESQAKSAKEKADELKARIDKEQTKLSENDLDELIGMYNTTIRSYNSLVGKFTMITEQYNKAAETYNNCILK
jgi:uncharacterized protein YkwD